MNLTLIIILLVGMVVSAAVCVLLRDLLKSCIAIAAVSALLAVVMFMLGANLAAVFELSVCAGLITVIFVSNISMTKIRTKEELAAVDRKRRIRFYILPVLLIVLLTAALIFLWPHFNTLLPDVAAAPSSVGEPTVFWNERPTDLLGQIVIVLAGVYGVLLFFRQEDERR